MGGYPELGGCCIVLQCILSCLKFLCKDKIFAPINRTCFTLMSNYFTVYLFEKKLGNQNLGKEDLNLEEIKQ